MEQVHPSWLDVLSDPVRLSLLRALIELGEASAAKLGEHSHASDPTLRRHLEAMIALGLVCERRTESDGLSPGRPGVRFSLHPRARDSALALFEVLSEPFGPWPRRTPSPERGR